MPRNHLKLEKNIIFTHAKAIQGFYGKKKTNIVVI